MLRCANTLELSADEARRNVGEVVPFDAYGGSENRQGWFTGEPLGIIVAITPYNDPLNLVAHKLGPAAMPWCSNRLNSRLSRRSSSSDICMQRAGPPTNWKPAGS
ncbi:aldehyde dehydrogenase family protein [Paraburkholderia xenovorans]|uniref:aldehyde dehydrogenase family protein n=1 Tax=Paraburkholderia xenovorans TaxID=36873 RepID=UPI0038B74CC3